MTPYNRDADADWWKRAVVYQVYPRSFADSDGDGIGDLGGVLQHLDHIAALGVDVVWLSPIAASPQADNGYDISDYRSVDPVFGTLEQLDELIAGLHERGIRLVMDLVVNHTSDEHPWFVASRSSRDDPKRDWYIWRDARAGTVPGAPGAEPNNWASLFSGSAWRFDETTGQYCLHLFHTKQPDLNWEHPDVRHAVHEMMRWWLDRGVDGFRMDVINFVSKVPGLPDARPVPGRSFAPAQELYANGPRIHEFLAELHREVFADRPGRFLTVGEMPGVTPEQAVLYTDPARAEVDMVFQFEHVDIDHGPGGKWDAIPLDRVALKQSLHRWQVALAELGWNSLYWNNHDQPRAVSRFGDDDPAYWADSAKALGTILHAMRGTPYVYQGEELGMTNYPFRSAAEHRDVEAVNFWGEVLQRRLDQQAALAAMARTSRDNARTPMQWDASEQAGFTTGTPWLPVNPNRSWLNAAAQVGDPGSVFEHYAALIRLRHEQPILVDGDFTGLLENDPDVWAFARSTASQRLLMLANCSRVPRTLELGDGWTGARLLLGSAADTADVLTTDTVTLAGWESRLYLLG